MQRLESLRDQGKVHSNGSKNEFYIEGVPYEKIHTIKDLVEYLLEELPEPQKLTNLEYELIKFWKLEGYNWIARDFIDNGIYLHNEKPLTNEEEGIWASGGLCCYPKQFNRLFQFIQWSDVEPTNLQELIDNCEVED